MRLENLMTTEYDVKDSSASLNQLNNSGIIKRDSGLLRSNSKVSVNSPRFS